MSTHRLLKSFALSASTYKPNCLSVFIAPILYISISDTSILIIDDVAMCPQEYGMNMVNHRYPYIHVSKLVLIDYTYFPYLKFSTKHGTYTFDEMINGKITETRIWLQFVDAPYITGIITLRYPINNKYFNIINRDGKITWYSVKNFSDLYILDLYNSQKIGRSITAVVSYIRYALSIYNCYAVGKDFTPIDFTVYTKGEHCNIEGLHILLSMLRPNITISNDPIYNTYTLETPKQIYEYPEDIDLYLAVAPDIVETYITYVVTLLRDTFGADVIE